MKNFKIYLCTKTDNAFFVSVYEDVTEFIRKYDHMNKQRFFYIDVGLIRPDNKFLNDLYEQYSEKSIISAAAKYALRKLISESTELYKFENEGDSNLISFLDLNIEIKSKTSKEVNLVIEFPLGSLGHKYIMPKNKLELSISVLELDVRSNNCLNSIGIHKIEDLLKISESDLLKVPNLGKESNHRIKKAISKLSDSEIMIEKPDLKKKFLGLPLDPKSNIFALLHSISEKNKDRHSSVFFKRIGLLREPKTLDKIGQEEGVTRERIRQIATEVLRSNYVIDISTFIDHKITEVRKNKVIPVEIKDLPIYEPWFNQIEKFPWIIEKILSLNENNKNRVFKIQENDVVSQLDVEDFKDIIHEIASYISSVPLSNLDLLLSTKFSNAPELIETARKAIEVYSLRGRQGTAAAILDTIFSNSTEPLSKEKVNELASDLGFVGTFRTIDNFLIGLNSARTGQASDYYLFPNRKFGLFEYFNFVDSDIQILEVLIEKEAIQAGSKQLHCNEVLKKIQNAPEFERLLCKDQIDQYRIKAIIQKTNKYDINRFMFSKKGVISSPINQSDLVIEVLETSDTPLTLKEIKKYISRRTNLSKNFQVHNRGRVVPFKEDVPPENLEKVYKYDKDKRGHKRKLLARRVKAPDTKWMLLDRHANLDIQKIMIIIKKAKALFSNSEVRESPEYKRGLDFHEITNLIRDDNDLNQFVGNINLLFSICERSAYFIGRNKESSRDVKDGLFLTQDFVPNKKFSSLNALKKVVINITNTGISKKNIELEIEKLTGKKPQMGQLMQQLRDMEFKYDEHDGLWFKRETIEF